MKLLIFCLVIFASIIDAKIDTLREKAAETHADPKKVEIKDAPDHKISRAKFVEDLRFRRVRQSDAIRGMKDVPKDKIEAFLSDVAKNVQKLLSETRDIVGRITLDQNSQLPEDEKIQDSLMKVLENTAFFADLSLTYSKFFEKLLKKNLKFKTLVVWAYHYSTTSGLFDEATLKKVTKMAQKYEIIEKSKKEVERETLEKASDEKMKKRQNEKEKEKKPAKKIAKGEL